VCHGHTAKHNRHTTNPLPWMAYGKPHTASNLTVNALFAVGQGADSVSNVALGKLNWKRTAHRRQDDGDRVIFSFPSIIFSSEFFTFPCASCRAHGKVSRICRVSHPGHTTKYATLPCTRQSLFSCDTGWSLCRVLWH
jgi:hypothetical protein